MEAEEEARADLDWIGWTQDDEEEEVAGGSVEEGEEGEEEEEVEEAVIRCGEFFCSIRFGRLVRGEGWGAAAAGLQGG